MLDSLNNLFWWVYGLSGNNSLLSPSSQSKSESQKKIDKEAEDLLEEGITEEIREGNSKIFIERYPSIPVMLEILDRRPHNKSFKNRNSSHDPREAVFSGTASYEEARKLCLNGWKEILPKIERKVEDIIYDYHFSKKSNVVNSVVGYCPNVPNALMNLPNSMFVRKVVPEESKTLFIHYCSGVGCKTSTETMIEAGCKLLALIKILEMHKVNIKLDLCFSGAYDTLEICMHTLNVKKYDEPLDLLKLSFTIAHPSMFRRIGFAAIETTPGLTEKFEHYGYPIDLVEYVKFLKKERNCCFLDVEFLTENNLTDIINYIKNEFNI